MVKKIFISYSHKDTSLKDQLMKQLDVLKLGGLCDPWEDRQIPTGENWLEDIKKAINEASVAVLIVSKGFLSSEFIMKTEVPLILEQRQKGLLTVLPLFVNKCKWKNVDWLKEIQGFPDNGKTLNYFNKSKRLTEFAGRVASQIKAPEFTATLFTPLPPRTIELIGREKDLAGLEKTLKTSKRVVLVNGLGGIGKTEVCKAFFLEHYEHYRYAAWVDWISSVRESMVNALGKDNASFIAVNEIDTPDIRFEKIKQRLCQIREPFLLVFDNIENPEDPDLSIFNSLPSGINVLVNSRSKIDGYECRNLDFLSPADCKTLFYEFYKGKQDDERVEKILALCGYHTLTVELLAKTAFHAAMTIGDLVQTLDATGFNLNRGETVSTFWHDEKEKKTFFDHLQKVFDISGVTEKELSLLVNLSVLPTVYIPIPWIAEWLKLTDNNDITSLIDKGWLTRDNESRIYMHPVIQEVVKYKTKPDAQKCGALIDSLGWKLKNKPGDNPIHKKEYLIYGESVVRAMGVEEKATELAALANNLSTIYHDTGQLDRALEFQLKAIEIRESVLDSQHPDLATSTNNVSMIYQDMGQLDRALEFQLKAMEIYESVLDLQHPLLATSYNNVSTIYHGMGQLDRALEFQLKALKIVEEVLDHNHPYLASSYNNVSMIYQDMGQLDQALEFQLKAIEIREAVLDSQHPSLATSYNNVSGIYRALGELDRALEFQLKAIEIQEAVLDSLHPDRATSYHNLSTIYRDMGQWNDALRFAEKAVTILQPLFPGGHPNLDKMKRNLEGIKRAKAEAEKSAVNL
ncbi:MAG: tetratricopeptide repeat protein [Candidatus Omnitrophota bacterium]